MIPTDHTALSLHPRDRVYHHKMHCALVRDPHAVRRQEFCEPILRDQRSVLRGDGAELAFVDPVPDRRADVPF